MNTTNERILYSSRFSEPLRNNDRLEILSIDARGHRASVFVTMSPLDTRCLMNRYQSTYDRGIDKCESFAIIPKQIAVHHPHSGPTENIDAIHVGPTCTETIATIYLRTRRAAAAHLSPT